MEDELKVSTSKEVSAKEKEEKVIQLLKGNPQGTSPKQLSFYTHINQNTIKSLLKRLELRGVVRLKEGFRGIYELVEKGPHSDLFSWNFQNVWLSCPLPDYTGEKIDETFDFDFVKYEFHIGKESQQASVHIIADHPINLSSISVCFSYFSLLVKQYANYLPKLEETTISCIEFNKDYSDLKFEGVKCITLTELFNQFKIYEKPLGIRKENKITVPIKAEAILGLLNNQTPYLSLLNDISIIKSRQEILEKILSNISKVIYSFLNKADKQKVKREEYDY